MSQGGSRKGSHRGRREAGAKSRKTTSRKESPRGISPTNSGGNRKGSEWTIVAGRHPVMEALSAGRAIKEILFAEGGRGLAEIEAAAERSGVTVRRMPRQKLDELSPIDTHQGVLAYVRPIPYRSLDEVLERATTEGPGLLLVCDGVVDPHNLGALIRSAEAAGAHGVIIGKHRAVGLTETVIKASAGAAYHLPVVQVTNITKTLKLLQEAGFWIVGASALGESSLWDVDLTLPVAIVVGSEGKGISRLVEETCDILAFLPMAGAVSSLNASVAGALFLYESVRQRRNKV